MASSRRLAELRASLARELESATQREHLDPPGRLRWLRAELENYLDRWLAFAAVDGIAFESLLRDDLFAMVTTAAKMFDEEFARGEKIGAAEWTRFQATLSRVQSEKDPATLPTLREELAAVAAALATKRS